MPNRSLGHSKSAFVGCLFVIQDDNDTLCLQTISASHCGCCHECRKICSVNFVNIFCVCVRDNTVSRSQLLSACFSVWSCSTVSLHTQHCMPRLPLSTELLVWAHSSRVALCDATEHTHRERHDVMLQSTLIASGIGICYRAFSNRA